MVQHTLKDLELIERLFLVQRLFTREILVAAAFYALLHD